MSKKPLDKKASVQSGAIEPIRLQVPSSGGKSFAEIDQQAEKAIKKNTSRFTKLLKNDLIKINQILSEDGNKISDDSMRKIFDLMHNLRGQGSLFDYPMVTVVGGYFCQYADHIQESGGTPRRDIVDLFVHALHLIETKNISGEGNKELQAMVDGLGKIVRKFLAGSK